MRDERFLGYGFAVFSRVAGELVHFQGEEKMAAAIERAKNIWTQKSIDYAEGKSYLDDLYAVYPVVHNNIRKVDESVMSRVERYFNERDNYNLIKSLLELDLFPVKDSYIPYLRKSDSAIRRNPKIIQRICGDLYEMGYREIYKRCTEPKEANRQMGPMFRNWLKSGALGLFPVPESHLYAMRTMRYSTVPTVP